MRALSTLFQTKIEAKLLSNSFTVTHILTTVVNVGIKDFNEMHAFMENKIMQMSKTITNQPISAIDPFSGNLHSTNTVEECC